MVIRKFKDMVGGWFIGNFEPTAFKTDLFEVCFKFHHKNEPWAKHYHKEATEINLIVRGKLRTQGEILEQGDIFVIFPNEISEPEFLEDCEIIVVKTPSVIGDKYTCE